MIELDLTPAPGATSALRRFAAQSRFELRITLRNGEQLLLTLLIPVALLLFLGASNIVGLGGGPRITTALAGTWAVAVLSSAFAGPAIAVGFERRSGALRLIGTTPLTRRQLLAAKAASILAVNVLQSVLLCGVAAALGWRPSSSLLTAAGFVLLGGASLTAIGFTLGGTLRAEATLAVANGVFLVLLLAGGTAIPAARLPAGLRDFVTLLPSGALGTALRSCLLPGGGALAIPAGVLVGWFAVGMVVAGRTFRWD